MCPSLGSVRSPRGRLSLRRAWQTFPKHRLLPGQSRWVSIQQKQITHKRLEDKSKDPRTCPFPRFPSEWSDRAMLVALPDCWSPPAGPSSRGCEKAEARMSGCARTMCVPPPPVHRVTPGRCSERTSSGCPAYLNPSCWCHGSSPAARLCVLSTFPPRTMHGLQPLRSALGDSRGMQQGTWAGGCACGGVRGDDQLPFQPLPGGPILPPSLHPAPQFSCSSQHVNSFFGGINLC